MKGISASMLSRIASEMKENKEDFSNPQLKKAISEFETALKILYNSGNESLQDEIKLLRESVAVLKK